MNEIFVTCKNDDKTKLQFSNLSIHPLRLYLCLSNSNILTQSYLVSFFSFFNFFKKWRQMWCWGAIWGVICDELLRLSAIFMKPKIMKDPYDDDVSYTLKWVNSDRHVFVDDEEMWTKLPHILQNSRHYKTQNPAFPGLTLSRQKIFRLLFPFSPP